MFEGIQLDQLPAAIEALLFVSDEPVSAIVLANMLEENVEEIEEALKALEQTLNTENRGVQLREVAGGWRLYTHPAYHELIEKYVLSWDTRRLSSAALETLAIVAYAQPVTRAQVSEIRGVMSDSPLATLLERGYIKEAGTLDAPGNPLLYATTRTFLEKYGLRSVADLPDLAEFAPDEKTAQLIRERLGAVSAPGPLAAGFAGEGEGSEQGRAVLPGGEGGLGGSVPIDERDIPSVETLASSALGAAFGTVEKIDFDSLTFNMDDE